MSAHDLNLLPWRKRKEERHRRAYFVMLGMSVVAPCLGAFAMHWERGIEVSRLRAEVAGYRLAIESTEQMEAERALLGNHILEAEGWLAEFERLLQRRGDFLRLWTELAAHLPDSMHYQTVVLEGSSVTLSGVTSSSPDLATYMRRLEASALFASPRLIDLEDTPSGHKFGIEARLAVPMESV